MIGIIEDWLFTQLGIYLNLNKLADFKMFQDGGLLVDILQKYGLLNENFRGNITPTSDPVKCRSNLLLLKPLFDMLKVKYDNDIIDAIVETKYIKILKLLYELYVCLENKQHLYFITQQNYEKVQKDLITNLDVENLDVSSVELENPEKSDIICFEQPLIQNRDIIEWYKNKYKLIENNLNARIKLNNETSNEVEINVKRKGKEHQCSCRGNLEEYETLPNLDTFLFGSNHETILSYDQFIASFKAKQHHNAAKLALENTIQNDLLNQTWSKVMEKQKEIYDSVFSQIMLKQSQYEKQILTKLIQTQQQVKTENENQIQLNKSILNEQEKHLHCDLQLKEEFEELVKIQESEHNRVLELHRKLYKAKKALIKKRHYSLCHDVINSLVDIAINVSDYQSQYGVSVPKLLWDNWMQLFYKAEPIHIPFLNLESKVLLGNEIDYDEIIAFERQADDILNENDVDEYLFTCGKWFYKDIWKLQGDINEDILAFIVYRLLSAKYPPPPAPKPADLPPFKLAAALLNFHNKDCIEKLKALLAKSRIHVFDSETALKKCISTFEKETAPPIEEKTKGKRKQSKSKSPKSKNKGPIKSESEKSSRKSSKKKSGKKKEKSQIQIPTANEEEMLINLVDKETQTSIQKMEEPKPERTPLGLIGEDVFNVLRTGEKVDDYLLVSVIIEYLKTLEDSEGWLLLNYPLTLSQASVLELALTGKYIPMEDGDLEETETANDVNSDYYEEKRKSKLLPCLVKNTGESSFKTYFSVFIKVKENVIQHPDTPNKNYKTDPTQNEDSDILSVDQEEPETDNLLLDDLEEFYKEQSIYQDFYFASFDLTTLKRLARTILKEDGVQATCSIDLFGEELLHKLEKDMKKGKKGKKGRNSSADKQKSKGKSRKKSGKRKPSSLKPSLPHPEDVLGVEKQNLDLEDDQVKTQSPVNQDLQLKLINPGDDDWQNISLPINNEMAVMLASIWENIEKCYLNNLKDIAFENRMTNLRLIPYSKYVQDEVEKIINKPDMKQDLINIFQEYYNNFINELRTLPEVKNQFYCKVSEMQQSLWQITDERHRETEKKRQDIIQENWLVNELCNLINNYLSIVQTEFKRSVETMKLINDYYLNMLDKNPPLTNTVKFEDIPVSKLTVQVFLGIPNEISTVVSETDRITNKSETFQMEGSKSNFIVHSLINCKEQQKTIDLLNVFLLQEMKHAINRLQSISQGFHSQIKTEESLLSSASKKAEKKKSTVNIKEKSPKTITGKPKNVKEQSLIPILKKDSKQEISQHELLLKEWKFVIDTEIKRFNFRSDLIKKRAQENVMEFYCYLESEFCGLYNSALSRYNNDISNINQLCDYLKTAIEEETPLDQTLIISGSEYYVKIDEDLERKPVKADLSELSEKMNDCIFTINQLNKLKNIFKIAGPYGFIRKQPFCYILEDLMLFNAGDNQPHLPKMWNLLSESQLINVIDSMFGPEYAIDWRDFIIYNLEIPYPTIDDVLSLRKTFLSFDLEESEVIPLEVYESITLWFEKDLPGSPQEGLRIALIKDLLFEMFKVGENKINYTGLLLYFCKDLDPKLGLRKALCLSVGKNVITTKEELAEILRNEAEVKEIVQSLLTDIINSIILNREGVLIYEIFGSMSEIKLDSSETDASYSVSFSSNSNSDKNDQLTSKSSSIEKESQNDSKGSISSHQLHEIESPDKPWVSEIPISTVISVLNASFLHQDKTYFLRNQYLNCLVEEADNEGMIEAHVLVTLSCIQKLFTVTNRFKISLPCDVLSQYLTVEE